jgi:drug/metabolite transporter (DMT)-like permease
MRVNKPLGILAVLSSVIFWGFSFVSTKVVLTELPPVTIAFLRQFAALIPLFALCFIKKESLRIERNEILSFFTASFFGIVLYFLFENTGLTMTTASNASMLVATIPIFVLIAESVVQRKKIAFPSLVCIIASVLGVYFVVFEDGLPDFSTKTFLGNLLIFGAMFSWIIYTFVSEKLGRKYSSLKMTTIQTLAGIPLFLPFVSGEFSAWRIPSLTNVINILFLGIFCSGLAYVFFLSGIKMLGPVLPSSLLNLIPVVTILAGVIFLNETISFYQVIGTVLIVGSLTFLSIHKLKGTK